MAVPAFPVVLPPAVPVPAPLPDVRILPTAPSCVTDAGSWCAQVYGWTRSDLLSRWADVVLDRVASIAFIVLIALVARAVAHRAIDRLARGAAGSAELAGPLRSERRAQRARTIGSVLRSITSTVVLSVAAIMVMAEFGLDLAPVLASAGIAGVALGFGAQNLVRDFLSGMFMLLEDQYGVGDVVDLGEATGTVESVGLRITTVRDVRGTVWHVRNGAIARVGNKSQGFAVAVVDLPLAHSADLGEATRIAGEVSAEVAGRDDDVARQLLAPPEVLGVETVTVDGVTLRVTAKTQPGRQFGVQRALNGAITDAFDTAGLPRPGGAVNPARRPVTVPAAPSSPARAGDDGGSGAGSDAGGPSTDGGLS